MDISINSVVGIISQYTCISNHLIVYFKYITLLFVHSYADRHLGYFQCFPIIHGAMMKTLYTFIDFP